MMNVLILGSVTDPHVTLIKTYLESRSAKVDVLDIYERPDVELRFGDSPQEIEVCGRKLTEFSAVLNRMKWRWDPFIPDEPAYLEYFHNFEWVYLLRGLMLAAARLGVPVVNGPVATFEGGNKVLQLLLAREAGLYAPTTLITSRPAAILELGARDEPRIAKVFEASFVPAMGAEEAKAIFTTSLRPEDFPQLADTAGESPPMLIQGEVRKTFEARLIASSEGSVCYRIDSQAEAEALVDWRRVEFGMTYETIEAPQAVIHSSLKLLDALGLDFGVFDFAVGAAGQWTFFECNPDGQWWLARQRGGGDPERVLGDVVLARASAARASAAA